MSDYFTGSVPSSGPAPSRPTAAWAPAPPAPPAYAAPAYVPTQPGYPPVPAAPTWPPYAGRPMSGGVLGLLVAGCVLGAVVVVGMLAAVAIPVFLNQRAKAEAAATTVSIPEQLVGLTRLHDARSLQMEQQLRNQPGQPAVGVYGVGNSIRAAVSVNRHAMTIRDDNDFLRGAEASFQNQGIGQVVFATVDPGRLHGQMRCATLTSPKFSVCLFADRGAYGSITLFGDMTGRADTAVAVREAVEHRT